jgi:hypothetical protein
VYLLHDKVFNRVFDGYDLKQVCDSLVGDNVLLRDVDQYKRLHRIPGIVGGNGEARLRLYTIDASLLDDELLEDENTVAVNSDEYAKFLEWQKMSTM